MKESVSDIGEFGLIRLIEELLDKEGVHGSGLTLGMGDDAACFRSSPGFETLVTCDAFVQGRHWIPGRITPLELGRRTMTANISDIGAMGGRPLYALVSLGLKQDIELEDVVSLYRGFLMELNPMGVCIAGGNITGSSGHMFIDITLIGEVESGKEVRRSGGRPGDRILVTGYPGQASAGLFILLESGVSTGIDKDPLVRAYRVPAHRAREGRALAEKGLATAMIDMSDGLLGDLGHICERSGVGAEIKQEKIPMSRPFIEASRTWGFDPLRMSLGESDDYELIITCAPDSVPDIRKLLSNFDGLNVSDIGTLTPSESGLRLIGPDGTEMNRISRSGWDHFIM